MKPQYGYWWLADRPAERVAGVLEVGAQGQLTLSLYGRLDAARTPSGWVEGEQRVLGEVDMGAIVSLDRCFVQQVTGDFGLPRQIWHVHDAVIGAKFDATEPWAFCGAQFELPLVTGWTQRHSAAQFLKHDERGCATRLGIAVQLQKWPLWERDGIQVELTRSASVREKSETVTALEAPVLLSVHAPRALTSAAFREIGIRPLQVLIGLATGRFTATLSGRVLLSPRDAENRERYLPWHWQPLKTTTEERSVRFGFHYADVLALGPERFAAWIGLHDAVDPVLDLYLGVLRETGLAELSFLMVVQALETYHRRTGDETLLEETSWTPLRADLAALITAATNGRAREALLGKLDFYNEVSLRHRLKALLGPLSHAGEEICARKTGDFINAVVSTRNYYTHWDVRSEAHALRGHALAHATSRLTASLEILLLRDLGFASDSAACQEVLRRRVRWLPKS